jgi:integrase
MRPGEVVLLRGRDLERCGKAWTFTPHTHKMEHRDRPRVIFLGPKAQDVVRPFLKADPDAYVFSPKEAEAERNAAKRAGRTSPMTPSQARRRPKRNRKRAPGNRYTPTTYRKCVTRACETENVDPFTPNQLRHSAATRIRKEYDLETARAVLGQASAVVTEIYAEIDHTRASRVAAESG